MTHDELIEQVARAIDPAAWEVGQPIPTRGAVVTYHSARQASIAKARDAIAAMQPRFKAERIRGGEMVKEAAATVSPTKTAADECETVGQWTRRTLREAIRALSVPAIVEAGEREPKENADASSD